MLPVIFIGRDKKAIESAVARYIEQSSIESSSIFTFLPESQIITISQVREIISIVSSAQSPITIIIHDWHKALLPSQNALLKTLEDGASKANFILTAQSQFSLPTTILSRLQVINVRSDLKIDTKLVNYFFDKNVSLAEKLTKTSKLTDEKVIELIEAILIKLENDLTTEGKRTLPLIRHLYLSYDDILRRRLSPEKALDHLLIQISLLNR